MFKYLSLIILCLSCNNLYGSKIINPDLISQDLPKISVSQVHAALIEKDRAEKKILIELGWFEKSEFKTIIQKEVEHSKYFPFYLSHRGSLDFLYRIYQLFKLGLKDDNDPSFHAMIPRAQESEFENISDFWKGIYTIYDDNHWNDHQDNFRKQILSANITYFGNFFL